MNVYKCSVLLCTGSDPPQIFVWLVSWYWGYKRFRNRKKSQARNSSVMLRSRYYFPL